MVGLITGVNRFHALEEFDADVQVSAGKRLIVFGGIVITSTLAKACGLQQTDTGVNDNATSGTNQVTIISSSMYKGATANVTFELPNWWGIIASSKFAQMSTTNDSGTILLHCLGVQVDN